MGMSYALFRGNMVNVSEELCNRSTVLYRFFRWTQMTAYAENAAEHWGFGSLPASIRNHTRFALESATCNGELILQCKCQTRYLFLIWKVVSLCFAFPNELIDR